jgi:phosphate transport system protein
MMRVTLDAKINELYNMLTKMSNMVETNIEKSLRALINQDVALAQEVIDFDKEINAYETEIEMSCVNVIATQTPLAMDLRRVFSVVKIVTDLERIGDHCVNVSRVVKSLGQYELITPLVVIPDMGERVKKMVHNSIQAFVDEEVNLARQTAEEDEIVDEIYGKLYRKLLDYMKGDHDQEDQIIGLLLVGRYFERMADHATNICERLIYLETGENVKY